MESNFKDNPHYHQVLQLPQDTDLLVTGVGSVSPVPGSHLHHHHHHHICDYFAALSMVSIIAMIVFSCHLTRIKNPGPLDTQSLSEISTSDIPPGIPCDSANSQVNSYHDHCLCHRNCHCHHCHPLSDETRSRDHFRDQNVTLPRVTRLVSRPFSRPKWSRLRSRDQYRHQNVTLRLITPLALVVPIESNGHQTLDKTGSTGFP